MRTLFQTLLAASACATALAAPAATPAKQWPSDHPAFYGTWEIARPTPKLLTRDGKAPPLLPAAAAAYARTSALKAKGDTRWDPVMQCKMHGSPRILYETMPFQFAQTPKMIFILSQWNREFRMIDMNVEHSEPPGPQLMGQSVGHWEGDTLVVDTNAFDPSTYLDASGLPHSDQLHLVERFKVAPGGATMTDTITIEDPKTFSRPWTTVATFRKLPASTRIVEDACVERLNLLQYK